MLHYNVRCHMTCSDEKKYQVRNTKLRAQRAMAFSLSASYLFALVTYCSKVRQNTIHIRWVQTSEISLVYFFYTAFSSMKIEWKIRFFFVCVINLHLHFIHYFIFLRFFTASFFVYMICIVRLTRGGEFRTLSMPGGLMSSGSSSRRGDRWIKARRSLL